MQCPKASFVRVLVLSEIYVNSFSSYHVIKEKKTYLKDYNRMILKLNSLLHKYTVCS